MLNAETSSVTKSRLAYQITASPLYKLLKEAYQNYLSEDLDRLLNIFEEWGDQCVTKSPQFQFWQMVMDMELVICMLICSFMEGNFDLYIEAF